jgi:predicted O-methyltransferase YrrM
MIDLSIIPENDSFFTDKKENAQDYFQVKYDVCKRFNPKRILEIGIGWGYSAYAFLSACPDAYYLGIDINANHRSQYIAYLNKYNFNSIIVNSTDITDLYLPKFDFIHIDGDHSYSVAYRDMEITLRVLEKNGAMLVDDYDNPKVALAIKDFMSNNPQLKGEYIDSYRGDYLITYRLGV